MREQAVREVCLVFNHCLLHAIFPLYIVSISYSTSHCPLCCLTLADQCSNTAELTWLLI